MLEAFDALIDAGELGVVETVSIPPRPERRRPIPAAYREGPLGPWLASKVGADGTLWNHQSLALKHLCEGDNIVVSTGTASGKSLIFQLAVAQELLSGDGRALVLYPLKALLGDQLLRWREFVQQLGLPPTVVAELHGQVSMDQRQEAVAGARVVLATPDIVQAWLMRQVSSPMVRDLLCGLRFLVLDEAHSYESVFGSNVAYLLRRVLAARRRTCREKGQSRSLQIIAATATIADPAEHMLRLTGWPFKVVGEAEDGSPSHARRLLHIEGPDKGGAAEGLMADMIGRLAKSAGRGSLIAFHDSRQGVERVARSIDDDSVLPYRSGYEAADRQKIERALRNGDLRGVVSTSALELGIDIKGFLVGLNVGVPQSKKAFRQRLGRVGRDSAGAFAVIASRTAFTSFGSSFAEYYAGSVEPSHLYLENRFIQFAQARCLQEESELLRNETKEPPPGVSWPDSFPAVYEIAKRGARRPREYEFIATLGADSPHHGYPLRQVGEANFRLKDSAGGPNEDVETIAFNQAIREAYPGATYLSQRKPMHVVEWKTTAFERSIRLRPVASGPPTKPLLKKTVNIGFGPDEIVGGRIMSAPNGLLAEVSLQVNESVEGYWIGSKAYFYRDLRQENPRMTRKQRDFSTTGVVIQIREDWFQGGGASKSQTRAKVAEALAELLQRERSLAPTDIDSAATNIALYENGAPRRVTDTIVIYYSIYGGLRLTEPLFDELRTYLARLARAAELVGDAALLPEGVADKLLDWVSGLQDSAAAPDAALSAPVGEYLIYAPGSVVSVISQGVLLERELIEPKIIPNPFGDGEMVVYCYNTGGKGTAMVPHEQVQATGQDWSLAFWNPKTGQIRPTTGEDGEF